MAFRHSERDLSLMPNEQIDGMVVILRHAGDALSLHVASSFAGSWPGMTHRRGLLMLRERISVLGNTSKSS